MEKCWMRQAVSVQATFVASRNKLSHRQYECSVLLKDTENIVCLHTDTETQFCFHNMIV